MPLGFSLRHDECVNLNLCLVITMILSKNIYCDLLLLLVHVSCMYAINGPKMRLDLRQRDRCDDKISVIWAAAAADPE